MPVGLLQIFHDARTGFHRSQQFGNPLMMTAAELLVVQGTADLGIQVLENIERIVGSSDTKGPFFQGQFFSVRFKDFSPSLEGNRFGVKNKAVKIKNEKVHGAGLYHN